VLYRYKDLLEKHAEELARTLTTENGKTLEDARAEIRRAIQMVEVSCGMPSLMMGQSLENVASGIDCQTIRQPLGVCAGITPFNFPAMVPSWMYPFAIACGNSFVLKPSEKVPLTPTRMAELLDQAGAAGRRPSTWYMATKNPWTRSSATRWCAPFRSSVPPPLPNIFTRTQPRTVNGLQALGGAKNHLVVMPDAELDKSADAIMASAFGAAGERCLAGSVLGSRWRSGPAARRSFAPKVSRLACGRWS